jgi:hypothetical protein
LTSSTSAAKHPWTGGPPKFYDYGNFGQIGG